MELEFIRTFCLSFPAAKEEIKWDNNLVFSVGKKMFCVASLEPPFSYSLKVKNEDFEEFSVKEGFMPAPYLARAKWVKITEAARVGKKDTEKLLKDSYELVKESLTKKLRIELDI